MMEFGSNMKEWVAGSTVHCDDVLGMVCNGDHYSLESPPNLRIWGDDDAWSIQTDNYSPSKAGVIAKIDNDWARNIWGNYHPDNPHVAMTVPLQPLDSVHPPVWFRYSQNYAADFAGAIDSVKLGTPGGGGIQVELTTGANTAWDSSGWVNVGDVDGY